MKTRYLKPCINKAREKHVDTSIVAKLTGCHHIERKDKADSTKKSNSLDIAATDHAYNFDH